MPLTAVMSFPAGLFGRRQTRCTHSKSQSPGRVGGTALRALAPGLRLWAAPGPSCTHLPARAGLAVWPEARCVDPEPGVPSSSPAPKPQPLDSAVLRVRPGAQPCPRSTSRPPLPTRLLLTPLLGQVHRHFPLPASYLSTSLRALI